MISVIVVTYNRRLLLERCINTLLSQNYDGEYEIIVIDDCSKDGTSDFVKERYRKRVTLVKNQQEEGLRVNKNKGIKIAKGDIIAFTDDDCMVAKDWLKEIEGSLVSYDFVGGVVLPSPDTKFPCWWKRSLDWMVGVSSNPSLKFLPLGSNLAFKKGVIERIGGFDTSVRHIKGRLLFGEDKDIIKRALGAGFKMTINCNMVVYHYVPGERLTLSYLLKRSYREGWSWAITEPSLKIIFQRIMAFVVNPFRFLISLDINYLCRTVVSLAYIVTLIREK